MSGNLVWSLVHRSEKFWRENVGRFEENNFKVLGYADLHKQRFLYIFVFANIYVYIFICTYKYHWVHVTLADRTPRVVYCLS